jgi:hypothetical protein
MITHVVDHDRLLGERWNVPPRSDTFSGSVAARDGTSTSEVKSLCEGAKQAN